MNAGRKDKKIAIHALSQVTGSNGFQTDTWNLLTNEWAEVRNLKGDERLQAEQIAGGTETKFTIRHNSTTEDITNKHRIVIGNNQWDILQALHIPGGRPTHIELYARRNTTDPIPVLDDSNILSTDWSEEGNLEILAAIN